MADPTSFPGFIPPSSCTASIVAGDVAGLVSAVNSANGDPDAVGCDEDE